MRDMIAGLDKQPSCAKLTRVAARAKPARVWPGFQDERRNGPDLRKLAPHGADAAFRASQPVVVAAREALFASIGHFEGHGQARRQPEGQENS